MVGRPEDVCVLGGGLFGVVGVAGVVGLFGLGL